MREKLSEKDWQNLFGQLSMKDMILASAYLNEAMAYLEAGKENDQDTTNLHYPSDAKFWMAKFGNLSMKELIVVSSYLTEAMAKLEVTKLLSLPTARIEA